MKMKRVMSRCAVALVCAALVGILSLLMNPAAFAGEKVTKFRFGGDMSLTLPPAPVLAKWVQLVKERTQGRYEIELFLERKLGSDKDMPELIRAGVIDMGLAGTAMFDGYFPTLNAFQLPFLINSYDALQKVYLSDATDELLSAVKPLGLQPIGLYECGFRHIANNVKPIVKPEDLKGMKIRVAETKMHQEIFTNLGAIPVPISYGEIYTSLQTGVIKGTEINATSASSEKLMEVIKYFSLTGHFFWPSFIFVNQKVWDGLPQDVQKTMVSSFKELIPYQINFTKETDEAAMKIMEKRGIKINQGDSQAFFEGSKFIYEKYMKDPPVAKFVNAVQAMQKK
jgi:TRAP-type transport system periplasmic protein